MSPQGKLAAARTRIRWTAMFLTAISWVIGTYVAWVRGHALAGAATLGATAALCGLVAWIIYHAISHRNDFLAIHMIVFGSALPRGDTIALPFDDELTRQAVSFIIGATASVVVGLYNPQPRKGEEAPKRSLLWDAEIDPPAPG